MRIALSLAAVIATASAALAQSASQQIVLDAYVDGYCTIDDAAVAGARLATVTTANGKVASPGPLSLSGPVGQVTCTSNATVQMTSANGGMANSNPPPGPTYVNRIHYVASASYNGKTESLTTTDATPVNYTTAGQTTANGAQSNTPLTLSVSSLATPAGKSLVSGGYSDTITVTLTPVP